MTIAIASNRSAAAEHYDAPFPPRFRWLKRGIGIALVVVGILVGIRAAWQHSTNRLIADEVRAVHARGERILPEDFAPATPVPDKDDALLTLVRAARAIDLQGDTFGSVGDGSRLTLTDRGTMKRLVEHNRSTLDLLRAAGCQEKFDPRGPGAQLTVGDEIEISRLYELAIWTGYLDGRDSACVEYLLDATRIAHAFGAVPMGLQAHQGGSIAQLRWLDPMLRFIPALRIAHDNRPGVPAERVRALINALLDERGFAETCWRAVESDGSRLLTESKVETPAGWFLPRSTVGRLTDWFLVPKRQADAVVVIRKHQPDRAGVLAANYPAARSLLSRPTMMGTARGMSTLETFNKIELGERWLLPISNVRFDMELLCERRAAATMLAVRLYQVDHNDQLPAHLGLLIPQYLNTLPADPFRADGATFRYRPSGDTPLLYSVGTDGIDNGGTSKSANTPAPRYGSGYRGNDPDTVFWLFARERRDTVP